MTAMFLISVLLVLFLLGLEWEMYFVEYGLPILFWCLGMLRCYIKAL